MFSKPSLNPSTIEIKALLNSKKPMGEITQSIMNLLQNGGDANTADKLGNTILHRFAVDKAERKSIQALVGTYKAKTELKNAARKTPLHALMDTSCDIGDAMTLVRLGANPDTKDSWGMPLLHRLLLSKASARIIDELINTYHGNIHITDKEGQTALQFIMNNSALMKRALELVKLGALPTPQDRDGKQLLAKLKLHHIQPEILKELEAELKNRQTKPEFKEAKSDTNTGSYTYTSISRWHEPKTGKEKQQQEKLDAAQKERQEQMEKEYDNIFRL